MIAIAAPTFDPNGHLVLHVHPSNPYQASRRGSVTATLDGSVWPYDMGYSVGDQTISATWGNPTRAQMITLRYLIAYYAELIVSLETGCFFARCSFVLNKSTLILTMRLLRRLDG